MKHILIVDDDKDIGNLIETMLKKRGGYRVSRAFSGTEALLLLERTKLKNAGGKTSSPCGGLGIK